MGKINDSIISGTSGRTGRIVVANVNGIEISRIRPKKSSKPPTSKQLLVKDRFNKVVEFMRSYREYAKKFYGHKVGLKSPYNNAMGNILNSIECDMNNLTLIPHYDRMHFSKGIGVSPQPTAISSPNPYTLQIDWENNTAGTSDEDDYLVVLLAEDEQLDAQTVFYKTTTKRIDETIQLTLLPRYQNKDMHVWIAFVNNEDLYASNSIYIGSITII
ncbi:DUF6266 family protein [Faecalibacter bovis]|uniref:Uncharacterized protein n=1 Tax=Faecalibacter bovis TaxID=2898187 RepID=A0ABX7XF99_9FLAO|nr:DUF6266 family protein [Faecalibacter bovis]QTV06616.1 hypothetical protein J9309_04645 [Faecalibacter bovis]